MSLLRGTMGYARNVGAYQEDRIDFCLRREEETEDENETLGTFY